jgi:hypothetical protein
MRPCEPHLLCHWRDQSERLLDVFTRSVCGADLALPFSIVTLRGHLAHLVAPFLMTGFVVACGGKILGGNAGPGNDSGTGATDGGAGCVKIEVLPSDLSCGSDSDCELVRTGEVCDGQCWCSGYTPVNTAAGARFESEIASLTFSEGCGCPSSTDEARCLGGQCTLCGLGAQPAGCNDAGIMTIEDSGMLAIDGGEFDSGISTADGGTCVDIELSTYDQSCNQPSDCILIQTGEVCSGQCSCGGTPVSASEQSRYEQATSGIKFSACPCPAEFPIECGQIGQGVGNTCVVLPP